MNEVSVFDQNVEAYETWFEENKDLFQSEVAAIQQILPTTGKSVEIGAGTGLFAELLGIKNGIEPSENMRKKAMERGINVGEGFAENLPIPDETYDIALMITVDCFLDDVLQAFKESWRILSEDGFFIVAFIDRETPLGKIYEQKKQTSAFYKQAQFHSAKEIKQFLALAGFEVVDERQTIFSLENKLQEIQFGTGEGLFGVVKVKKGNQKTCVSPF